jgi:hypothetical protein
MAKQMDIVDLIRRIRAQGFAISSLFERSDLKIISRKAKGKPFESDEAPEVLVDSDINMWGDRDMFTKEEKEEIAKNKLK